MLLFANDIAIMTESEEFMAVLEEDTHVIRYMKINKDDVTLQGRDLEIVEEFTYLGSKITSDRQSKRCLVNRANSKNSFQQKWSWSF